jgi:hypothetical protein
MLTTSTAKCGANLAVWSPFLFFEEMHFKSSIATVNQK